MTHTTEDDMTRSTHTRTDQPGVLLTIEMTPPASDDAPWTAVSTLARPGRDDSHRALTLVPGCFDDARKAMRVVALSTLENLVGANDDTS